MRNPEISEKQLTPSINKKDLIAVRKMEPGDINLIYATWLKGLYYGNDVYGFIDKNVYMENYHRVIEVLLTRPTVTVNIACLKEDPEVVLGYSVAEGNTLHWVFVKPAWRGIGLCKDLVSKNTNVVTHITKIGMGIVKKHRHIKFNPFL